MHIKIMAEKEGSSQIVKEKDVENYTLADALHDVSTVVKNAVDDYYALKQYYNEERPVIIPNLHNKKRN